MMATMICRLKNFSVRESGIIESKAAEQARFFLATNVTQLYHKPLKTSQPESCMCGRFNVSDSPAVKQMLLRLGIDTHNWPIRISDYHRACSTISIVCRLKEDTGLDNVGECTVLEDAIWWLLLDYKDGQYKPSRFTSFNSRYDKLNVQGSAAYLPYRQSRCIIPASGFGETEHELINGKKKPVRYTNFSSELPLALGGLYRQWQHPDTGHILNSCSIITLPPHPKLQPYQSNASPLILPLEGDWLEQWLDPQVQDVERFNPLLEPCLRQDLSAQMINKPGERQAIADPVLLEADA